MEASKKITYEQLIIKNNLLVRIDITVKDKLSYYCGKLSEKIKKHLTKYQIKESDICIDSCSVDKDGNILLTASKDFIYSKEGMKKRNTALEKLSQEEIEVDFSGCICLDKARAIKLPLNIINELNGILFEFTEEELTAQSAPVKAAQN